MGIRLPPSPAAARAWLAAQAAPQAERLALWAPVAMGCGAAVYFALPREPVALVAWGVLIAAGLLLALRSRFVLPPLARVVLVLAACALLGFALAKLRTEAVGTVRNFVCGAGG